MKKAVVDTNVLISGLFWEGTPKKVIDKFRYDPDHKMIFSPELIHELRSKLLVKFKMKPEIVTGIVSRITQYSELVNPKFLTEICRDKNDNMVLDTALAGNADYIISGDRDLLTLKEFNGIKIVTPGQFIPHSPRRVR